MSNESAAFHWASQQLHFTAEELAEATGVSYSTAAKWANSWHMEYKIRVIGQFYHQPGFGGATYIYETIARKQ